MDSNPQNFVYQPSQCLTQSLYLDKEYMLISPTCGISTRRCSCWSKKARISMLKVDLMRIYSRRSSEKGHSKAVVQLLVKKGADIHTQGGPYEDAFQTAFMLEALTSGLPRPENYITSRKKPDINDPLIHWLNRNTISRRVWQSSTHKLGCGDR